jgi:hypothetical protein
MPNPGFTLSTDAALKSRLQTLYVSDDRNQQRPLKAFFRYPDGETEKLYPFATIDLLAINHATDRQESEVNYYYATDNRASGSAGFVDYYPDEYSPTEYASMGAASATFLTTRDYVPVDILYQVSTHCRSARHDRQLTAAILRYVFPFRRGFIEVPEDGTIRRCDLLNWRQADVLDQEAAYNKRIFRKVYTLRVNAEIPQEDLVSTSMATSVVGALEELRLDIHVPSPSSSEDF